MGGARGPGGPAPDEEAEMSKPRPVKVTTPQILAMRSCLRDHFRGVIGHHDGMTLKALRSRGWLNDSNILTDLGRQALIRHDEIARNAFVLDAEFTRWAGFGIDADRHIVRACHRFCPQTHEDYVYDELGNCEKIRRHHTPMACLVELAEAGVTPQRISHAFS
jgi:hypothetical protein